MKTTRMISSILASVSLLAIGTAQTAQAEEAVTADALPSTTLSLTVTGIEDHEGKMMIALFPGEDGYENSQAVSGKGPSVTSDSVSVSFENLVPGEYGIKLYHDVNADGEMNTNPFGMPTEPFAFSNSAKGRFGPAKWEAAKFTIEAGDNTHTISMN